VHVRGLSPIQCLCLGACWHMYGGKTCSYVNCPQVATVMGRTRSRSNGSAEAV
jgi:hypothetical protein